MRIVTWDEFVKLPNGTVFSYWVPSCPEGLYVRGDTIMDYDTLEVRDFYKFSLIGDYFDEGGGHLDFDYSRDGMYDYEQQFLVYDAADVATITKVLNEGVD